MDKQFEFLMYQSADEEVSVNSLIKEEKDSVRNRLVRSSIKGTDFSGG